MSIRKIIEGVSKKLEEGDVEEELQQAIRDKDIDEIAKMIRDGVVKETDELLKVANVNKATVAHILAGTSPKHYWSTDNKEILKLTNTSGSAVALYLARLAFATGWTTNDPEILKLADSSGKTVADYLRTAHDEPEDVHSEDVVDWDINAIEQALRKKTGKSLTFDDYDMNGLPLFIDAKSDESEEWWVDKEGTIWYASGRGDNEKIGNLPKDIVLGSK